MLSTLNDAQRRAVQISSGPVLILAGPGSGKTRVITHRIAHLVLTCHVSPFNILAVTFTNRAAREMSERLQALIPGQVSGINLGTFHAICARILRHDGPAIGIERNFVIYDEDDQERVMRQVMEEINLDSKRVSPGALLAQISKAKSELRDLEGPGGPTSSPWERTLRQAARRYQELLRASNAVDFDDLLVLAVRLFQQKPDVLKRYQQRWQHILVDEFQDTNVAQYALVKLLAAEHHNLCVVGDEDQSIYSWRQADIRNILSFEIDFPDAQVVYLEQNYRSTKTILKAAREVISANSMRKEKNLWTQNETGAQITVVEAYDEEEEAQFVADEVQRLVEEGAYQFRDFAVMYRTNAQSRALETAFRRRRLPHKVIGMRFFERREIKDVLAYLRLLYNPADSASLQRIINVPNRGLGPKTVADLRQWAERLGMPPLLALHAYRVGDLDAKAPFSRRAEGLLLDFASMYANLAAEVDQLDVVDLIETVLSRSGYAEFLRDGSEEGEERWRNVQELLTVASGYAEMGPRRGLEALLEETALVADADEYDEDADATTLITLHAAKGLEFPVVFITGFEEGICPHQRALEDPNRAGALEEERRLVYVGMTRARQRLYLVYAFRRSLYGSRMTNKPSPYLRDIPPSLLRLRQTQARRSATAAKPAGPPTLVEQPAASVARITGPQFRAGERVQHPKFGEGVVLQSEIFRGDEEVTVNFPGIGIKRLSVSLAPLEKL